ncbi:MAG: DUF6984 family protein [Hydrogenophaga sp.]|uniref:DUF6984 family protein n=1 Tax=Hydrogenophaga sp. TaxID=1904254 RepID=UPI00403609D5
MKWLDFLKQGAQARRQAAFPYFVPVPERKMDAVERELVEQLLRDASVDYRRQLESLRVVGRCGCGECPTVFFQVHRQGDAESDLVTAQGRDESGGLVAAVLLEKNGALSQLEFYSIDGHSPWSAPKAETFEPW